MALIAILAALALERLLGRLSWWGEPFLFEQAVRALRRALPWQGFWRSPAVAPFVLLPPLALIGYAETQISNPLVALAASSLVLLLCLGPRDLADDVNRLLAARAAGRSEEAARLARALQRGPGPDTGHRSLVGALFIQSHERLFGVLFWFFALGPSGAVLYRLCSRLPRLLHEDGDSLGARFADDLHGLLAWVPARLTALLFGLAGSLDDALRAWAQLRFDRESRLGTGWRRRTWAVLAETATGGLETDGPDGGGPSLPSSFDELLREVLRLQRRALLILLAFFAFFATGAWVSG